MGSGTNAAGTEAHLLDNLLVFGLSGSSNLYKTLAALTASLGRMLPHAEQSLAMLALKLQNIHGHAMLECIIHVML